jgi:hypothetical protein
MSARLKEALEEMPVAVLTGPRQVGKSTLFQNDPAFSKRRYVTFDDFAALEAAQRDPETFLEGGPLTLDEVQRFPGILLAIKKSVDRNRRKGAFVLGGSANLRLLEGVAESLAGRAVYLDLQPFTPREAAGRTTRPPALKALLQGIPPEGKAPPFDFTDALRGGMPSVILGDVKKPEIWFKGYVQTYLERDLRDLSHVGDLAGFRQLMKLAALRTGGILSLSDLARDAKMNVMTLSRYFSLLETSYLIRRLPPYLGNRASRLVKSPKLYFADSGLAAHLAGMDPAQGDHPLKGAILENWVVQNLLALSEAVFPNPEGSYWNIQGRYEVDFILESEKRVLAVEVKWGSRPRKEDLRGLEAFLKTQEGPAFGVLATTGRDTVPLGKNLWAVPIPLLLS